MGGIGITEGESDRYAGFLHSPPAPRPYEFADYFDEVGIFADFFFQPTSPSRPIRGWDGIDRCENLGGHFLWRDVVASRRCIAQGRYWN